MNSIKGDLGGSGSALYGLFMLFLGVPYVLASFSAMAMDFTKLERMVNSILDNAFELKNGHMKITSTYNAFRIRKQTYR